jgi:hypothetical protein
MNLGDIAIGAAKGLDSGIRTTSAIQDVWDKQARSKNEQELAPLRLSAAKRQDELGGIQLDKAKREEAAANTPWNPMEESFIGMLKPEELDHYKKSVSSFPQTQEGKTQYLKNLETDNKSVKMMGDIAMRKAQEKVVKLSQTMNQLLASGDVEGAKKVGSEIEQLRTSAMEQSKAVENIYLRNDVASVFSKLKKEDQEELKALKDSPEAFIKALTSKIIGDKNINLQELALKAGKGDKDAIKAMGILEGFYRTRAEASEANRQDKPLPAAQANAIDAEISRSFRSDPAIAGAMKKEFDRSSRNKTPLFNELRPEQQAVYNEMKKYASALLQSGQVKDAASAVYEARKQFGRKQGGVVSGATQKTQTTGSPLYKQYYQE